MTKQKMIEEIKENAEIYRFKNPKNLEKMKKEEIRIIYESQQQAIGDYIDYQRGRSVW